MKSNILLFILILGIFLVSSCAKKEMQEPTGNELPDDYLLTYSEGNCLTTSGCSYAGEGCGGGHGICTNNPEKYEGAVRYQKYQDKVLCEYAKKAFQILDMSDYGRFDVRIDPSGRYFFLDANTNPQLGPHNHDSPVGMVLHLYGVPFSETLRRILLNTMKQWSGRQY